MICVNELGQQKCRNRAILQQLIVILAPFAPHISEELWHTLGHNTTVCDAQWPSYDEKYLVEDTATIAVSFNGKARFNIQVPTGTSQQQLEQMALNHENSAKWLEGKTVRKIIVVPNKIVNIVVG